MTVVKKLFALMRAPLFRGLRDSELIPIANIAIATKFSPGAEIAREGSVLNRLIVAVEGDMIFASSREVAFPVAGIESLVMDSPLNQTLVAGSPGGVECLQISKAHFFTIINECPGILTAYLKELPPDPDHQN